MKFSELIRGLDGEFVGEDCEVCDIANDSREVTEGSCFVAVKGHRHDGHDYVWEARKKGAVAFIVERKVEVDAPQFVVNNTYRIQGVLASRIYNYPSDKLGVFGITGTCGKTTTTYFMEAALKELGLKPGVIGTVEYRLGNIKKSSSNTTPDGVRLQRLFKWFVDEGANAVAMEVSSHSLKLERVVGTRFDAVGFTNLSPEHQEFHVSMEDYYQAKRLLFTDWRLFKEKTVGVINLDDNWGMRLRRESALPVIGVGRRDGKRIKDIEFEIIETGLGGSRFKLIFSDRVSSMLGVQLKDFEVSIALPGLFNVYNALMAFSMVLSAYPERVEKIVKGIESLKRVPGRFELIDEGQDFAVVVDYAHTSESLKKLLELARELTEGRVIVVFGCGGDRAREKRPMMGKYAAELADYVVVTSDNPRSEDPLRIIDDILVGIKGKTDNYVVIPDRREAIFKAIKMAKNRDTVVIAGKGHETYQIIGDKVIDFDDREIARQALMELGYKEMKH